MKNALIASATVLMAAACSAPADPGPDHTALATGVPPEGSEALTVTNQGQDGIYIERGFEEVLDTEKSDAIDEAFGLISSKLAQAYPDAGVAEGAQAARSAPGFDKVVSDGEGYLRSHVGTIADYGLRWTDIIPSGFFIVLGGKFTANAQLGGGGSLSAAFIVLPKKIQWVIPGENQVHTRWRFRVGVAGLAMGDAGVGAGGGKALRVGIGLIWGSMNDPQEFSGSLFGVSASANLGIGTNFKLLGLKRSATSLVDNVLFIASWESGVTAEFSLHGELGVAVRTQTLLDQIGMGSGVVSSPERVAVKR